MHNNDWVKELNESYRNNITNTQNTNEIVLTEEQLNEHFTNLAIIVESIENTFGIELTEEEIDYIDEQVQLNELFPLIKLGWTAGKRLIGSGIKAGGKAAQTGYKTKRAEAITKAKEATKTAQDKALKAWETGGRKGDIPFVDDIAPQMPKKGFLVKLGQKAEIAGKKMTPQFSKPGGGKQGFLGSTVKQAGYKGGMDLAKATGKSALGTLGILATGAAGAAAMLGRDGEGSGPRQRTSGKTTTTRGDQGEYDTDWETASGYVRPTGTRRGMREDYVDTLSQATHIIVENLYEVKLTENTKNKLYSNINQVLVSHNETE
jgi:hypothetical protein